MRIGTWNLNRASPHGPRGAAQVNFMSQIGADLWLVTEVHEDLRLGADPMHLAVTRLDGGKVRWCGISSRWPLTPVDVEMESLALARVVAPSGPLLVATSVMPWRGGGRFWAGRADAHDRERFAETLTEHLGAIQRSRQPSEPVVWGGDFNQTLDGPETGCSEGGRGLLLDAFASLGLVAVTRTLAQAEVGLDTIDHVAVPTSWVTDLLPRRSERVQPRTINGTPLSDHCCYICEPSETSGPGVTAGPASR